MDFQSFVSKRTALFPHLTETSSSSSTATLTSFRSSTSLEFDDNTKPSGVLVDDDFLPMSSPVDDHFWDLTRFPSQTNDHDCFPNVGSSPDLEVRRFDFQQIQNLSETSCDEEDEDETPPKFLRTDSVIKAKASQKFHPSTPTSMIDNNDDDDTQDSSLNDLSEGEDSADNGEIDLVQEFELSQKDRENSTPDNNWTNDERTDVFMVQEDDPLTGSSVHQRTAPTSIMKITSNNRSFDSVTDQQVNNNNNSSSFKPKVRFNLDPQYEREREWNKVNKLLGNSVEWTDEFEV